MKRWFTIIPDGSIDYAVVNNSTGEKEAIIAKTGRGGAERYMRFIRNENNGGCWEAALYHRYFPNLKEVGHYYECVNH